MTNKEQEQWLKNSQDYFKEVKAYNTAVMTVGYATFFGLLIFLQKSINSPLLFWAGFFIILSVIIFISHELVNQIKLSLDLRILDTEGKRQFRYWAWFFIPSLLFAVTGIVLLVYLFLSHL